MGQGRKGGEGEGEGEAGKGGRRGKILEEVRLRPRENLFEGCRPYQGRWRPVWDQQMAHQVAACDLPCFKSRKRLPTSYTEGHSKVF